MDSAISDPPPYIFCILSFLFSPMSTFAVVSWNYANKGAEDLWSHVHAWETVLCPSQAGLEKGLNL